MRKAKTVTVSRGWLTATGATKAEAKANLEPMIDAACNAAALHIEKRFECIIVVAANATGWSVSVCHPHTMESGGKLASTCQYGPQPYEDVVESARNWAAQNSWTVDITDDERFIEQSGLKPNTGKQDELRRWIKFQRRYIDLVAEGVTPNDAHRMAMER